MLTFKLGSRSRWREDDVSRKGAKRCRVSEGFLCAFAYLTNPCGSVAVKTPTTNSTLKGRRILFVLFNLELGGAERQALILAKHLVKHEEATVEVWGFNKSGPVARICDELGVAWRVVPYPYQSLALLKLARLLRSARPDILLPYTFVPNVVCAAVWRRTGARVCVWNQRDEGIAPFRASWERSAAGRASFFIANSEAGARFLVEQLSVAAENVRIIQNGIEQTPPQLDRVAWRAQLKLDEQCFVACMVANLHANKDHATLLKAWRRVVNEMNGRKPVLVLAGRHDGASESLAQLARDLNLDEHVRFTGQVTDVSGLLQAIDLGVFSSNSEGCPNGVLESMAAGLAVAGTDIDGIRALVGKHFLAPRGDDESLAAAILRLANDADLRVTIGTENRNTALAKFSAQRMCVETASVLKELLRVH